MPALNRVEIIGYLGRDPEERYTATGKRFSHFTVGVTSRWKSPEGEPQEATEWFLVEAWGRLGEICQEYLHKGSLVYVEGRLQTDTWQEEGETRYRTKVVARQMQMLDRKPGEEEPPADEAEP